MLKKCCSARISVGAMNATCRPFSIATSDAISATIVLPAPTSPCKQPVHRLRTLHVGDDLANRGLLIARQPERQHAPDRLARVVGDDDGSRLALGVLRVAAAARCRAGRGRTLRRSAGGAPASETR